MKRKLELIKKQFNFRKKSRKNFLLSVVALIEIIAIMVVSTYAWVETASTIIIRSNGEQAIDSYVYTNADLSSNTGGVIDLSKYYRASGNMHLASASSSDGSSIFFPKVASTSGTVTGLRHGEISDKNTNYISFNFKVTTKDTETKLIFDRVPEIKINGVAVTDNSIRVAVSDGTTAKVFSNTTESGNLTINGTDYAINILPFSAYAGSTAVQNTKYVLSLSKNQTKTVTVTVWLQDPNKAKEAKVTIGDLKLIPHTSSTREVRFTDYTTRFNTSLAGNDISWASNEGTQMWMRDVSRKELTKMEKSGSNGNQWVGYVENKSVTVTKGNVEFYNCDSSVTSAQVMSNYNCKWSESFNNLTSSELATVPDYKAYGKFANASTKTGLGTWHSLAEIRLNSEYTAALPKPTDIDSITEVTLKTNGGTGSSVKAVEMAYDNSNGYEVWRAYIPNDTATSESPQFTFTRNSKNYTKNYTYNAVRRDTSESRSTYIVTYDNTGYWVPPATVQVKLGNGCTGMGKVSVTGGVPGADVVKVTQGTNVTLKAESLPDNDTYGFVGWYTDPACTNSAGTNSNQSDFEVTAPGKNQTVTYYAKYMRQYKVTLYSLADGATTESTTGGTVQVKDKTQAVAKAVAYVFDGGSATIIAAPKASHNFQGWFNNAADASPVYDSTRATCTLSNVKADKILYAKFAIKKFDIEAQSKYEILNSTSLGTGANGGTVTINNASQANSNAYIKVTVNYDGSATFRAFAKDSDGYTFAGWYTDEACTTANRESTSSTYTVSNIHDNKKLYAKFELKTYNVTAHAVSNGTSNNSTYGTVCRVVSGTAQTASSYVTATGIKHGATVTFRASNKTNATFDGWYSNSACTTQLTASSTDVTLANSGKDITLTVKSARDIYAKFTPIKYKATAHAGSHGKVKVGTNDWSTTTSETDVIKGNSVTFYADANTGYEFDGWYTAATGGNLVSADAEYTATNVSGNLDYYARFKVASKRTIYFYNNDNWSTVYAYCWENAKGDGNENHAWSGVEMTYLGGKVWCYEYTPSSNWDKVVFNGGDSSKQTTDLNLPTDNTNTYYRNGNWIADSYVCHNVTVSSVSNAVVTVKYKKNNNTEYTIGEGASDYVFEGTALTLLATNITSGYSLIKFTAGSSDYTDNPATHTLGFADITVSATVSQSGKKIYFKPNSDWNSAGAWFTAYMWNGSSVKWYTMSGPDSNGYYSFVMDSDKESWTNIMFNRMNKDATKGLSTYNFNNNNHIWTQGGDMTIPSGKNCFTQNSGTWNCGSGNGSWSTK